MKNLIGRIVKSDVLKGVKDLMTVDLVKSENLLDYSEVDVGFCAEKSLKELTCSTAKLSVSES